MSLVLDNFFTYFSVLNFLSLMFVSNRDIPQPISLPIKNGYITSFDFTVIPTGTLLSCKSGSPTTSSTPSK